MLDAFLHHPAVGISVMVLGVLLIGASVLSVLGHGLNLVSSAWEPWMFLFLGGTLLLIGRLLLDA